MFNFFKKSNKVTDMSWLGVDIHSHILPGIDDGAKDMNESMSYIDQMQQLGYEKLIFTPHIFKELYPNSKETILPVLAQVKEKLSDSIKVGAAAEYMIDGDFEITNDLMALPNKYLLIEMSYLSESPNIEQIVFELQVNGYKVVLAHPERYNFYHKTLDKYERLNDIGCLFQLNLLSLTGYYGNSVKQATDYLISKRLYRFAGSDLHHEKHMRVLNESVRSGKLHSMIGHYEFLNKEVFS